MKNPNQQKEESHKVITPTGLQHTFGLPILPNVKRHNDLIGVFCYLKTFHRKLGEVSS
jgi:hypothetical protein